MRRQSPAVVVRHKAQETRLIPSHRGDTIFGETNRLVDPGVIRLSSLRTRRVRAPWSSLCGKCPSPIGLLWFCAISKKCRRTNRDVLAISLGNSEVAHHARARRLRKVLAEYVYMWVGSWGEFPARRRCDRGKCRISRERFSGKLPWRQRG